MTLDADYDRDDPQQRFRVYRQRGRRGRAECVATTGDPGGIGQAIVTLAAEGNLLPDDRVGVLDAWPNGEPSETGTWIVNPYPSTLGA